VAAWEEILDVLRREAPAEVVSGWYDTIYGTHLHWYLNNDSISNPEYWQVLRSSLGALRRQEPAAALTDLSPEKRVALLLLDADLRQEMISFRDAGGYEPGRFPTSVTPLGLRHALPVAASVLALLHRDVLVAPASSLSLRQQLLGGGWFGEGTGLTLRLTGFALIPALDLTSQPTHVEIFATNQSTGEIVCASVQRSDDPAIQPPPGNDIANYDGSGYRADFLINALRGGTAAPAQWDLSVRVSSGPFTVTEPLRNLSSQGGLTEAGCRMVDDEFQARLVGRANYHLGVRIMLERPAAVVEDVALAGRKLKVTFRASDKRRFFRLHLRAEGSPIHQTARIRRRSPGRFEAIIHVGLLGELREFRSPAAIWAIRAEDGAGREQPLSWENGRMSDVPIGTGTLRAFGSAWGDLALEEYPLGCVMVNDIDALPGALVLSCQALLPVGWRLETIDGAEIQGAAVLTEVGTGGNVRAELSVAGSGPGGRTPVVITATSRDETGRTEVIPVLLGRRAMLELPLVVPGGGTVAERASGRALALRHHAGRVEAVTDTGKP